MDKPFTLPCEADGLPPPDITWHKDGHTVVASVRRRLLSSGALHIAFARPEDAGQYTCTAANAAGASSASTRLTVHGRCCPLNWFTLLQTWQREEATEKTSDGNQNRAKPGVQSVCLVQVHLPLKSVLYRYYLFMCEKEVFY